MILSREAENLYWMARYVERVENTARIMLVNAHLLIDLPRGVELGWEPLLTITGTSKIFKQNYPEINERNVVTFLVSERANPGSITTSIQSARENLRTTRTIVPRGCWEVLNELNHYARTNKNQGISRKGRYTYLTHLIRNCQLITGNMSSSMSQDQTYEFVKLGRYVERSDMTTRVLEVRASNLIPELDQGLKPFDDIQWKSVLESLAAYQMYRRNVHVRVKGEAVLAYILQDPLFPRSISHCVTEIGNCLCALPSNAALVERLKQVQQLLYEVDIHRFSRKKIQSFMNNMQIRLGKLHDQIAQTYFHSNIKTPTPSPKKPTSERIGAEAVH